MKGKIIPLDFRTTEDSETGHRVIRMTPPHVICHRNYFYQKCFYPGWQQTYFRRRIRGPLELLFTRYCRAAGHSTDRRAGRQYLRWFFIRR